MSTAHNRSQRRFLLSILVLFVLSGSFLLAPRLVRTRAAQLQAREALPQEEPRAVPTPQPSPSASPKRKSSGLKKLGRRVLDFLSCDPANRRKTQELSQKGPQFPDEYDMSDFSIEALVKGNWAVAIEYELEAQGTIQITFKAKDVEPFSQTFSTKDGGPVSPNAQNAGDSRTVIFRLPEQFGDRPQPALISFKALADGPNGKVPADFQLYALGIGDEALKSALINQPGLQTVGLNAFHVKASFQGFRPLENFGSGQTSTPVGVAIVDINVTPSSILARTGGAFNYNFVSTNDFDAWQAEYRQNVMRGPRQHVTRLVRRDVFDKKVRAGLNPQPPPIPNYMKWQIGPGRVSPGQYSIQVCAWRSVTQRRLGGESAARVTSSLLNIN